MYFVVRGGKIHEVIGDKPRKDGSLEHMETIALEKMTYGIDSLGHLSDGKVVFVPYGAPQETAEVEIVEQKADYARARLHSIVQPSPFRKSSPCPNFPACGGCHWLHLQGETQRREKEEYLRYLLKPLRPLNVYPIEPLSSERYRNKMDLKVARGADNRITLGNYHFHSHDVVDLKGCIVQTPANMKMHEALDTFFNDASVSPHAEQVESVMVRTLGTQQHSLVQFKSPPEEAVVEKFREFFQGHETVSRLELASKQASHLTLMRDHEPFTFMGRPWTVSPRSFFQNNLEGAEAIYYTLKSIYDNAPPKGRFIDLYCGIGIQTMLLEHKFEDVVGVEFNEDSCNDAQKNQRGRRVNQLRFLARQAETVFGTGYTKGIIAALHMNPPRTGISQRVMRGLAGIKPKLMTYLSCNPLTFRRDAQAIVNMGFRLEQVYAFDLFPGTFHLEILGAFTR